MMKMYVFFGGGNRQEVNFENDLYNCFTYTWYLCCQDFHILQERLLKYTLIIPGSSENM